MGREIQMQTAMGNRIENEQVEEISAFERTFFPDLARRYSAVTQICAEPNPKFNCHGMTFACRRTGISDTATLQQILQDDGYEEIPETQVKPGDVIVYYDEEGDWEHSGLVVGFPEPGRGLLSSIPMVRSKWGKYRELIHPGNQCPYHFANSKYYRVVR